MTSSEYAISGVVWLDGKERATVTVLRSYLATVEKDLAKAIEAARDNHDSYEVQKSRAEAAEATLSSLREPVAPAPDALREAILANYIKIGNGGLPGGSQVLDGDWYAPKWGCDTLEHILDDLAPRKEGEG